MKDVVALITGGASGIGANTAEMIIKNGGKVIISDINLQGKQVADKLGDNASFFQTDVTSEKSVDETLEFIKNKYGKLNVLINCAGLVGEGTIYDFKNNKPHSLNEFKKMFEVDTFGTFNVMTRSIGLMKETVPDEDGYRGVIINIGSVDGLGAGHQYLAYGASKAAVMSMTETSARHLACVGIRVVAIAPSIIKTPLLDDLTEDELVSYTNEQMFPVRPGKMDEVSHLIKCIIENNFINAEIIRLDAGHRPSNIML